MLRRRAQQTPGLDDHKVSSEFPDGLEPNPALIQKLELKSQILTAGNPIAQNFRLKFKFIIQVENLWIPNPLIIQKKEKRGGDFA